MSNRSEEHTSELQSLRHLVCRLLLEKKRKNTRINHPASPTTKDHPASPALTRQEMAEERRNATQAGDLMDLVEAVMFFLNDTPPTEIYTLPQLDAFPI